MARLELHDRAKRIAHSHHANPRHRRTDRAHDHAGWAPGRGSGRERRLRGASVGWRDDATPPGAKNGLAPPPPPTFPATDAKEVANVIERHHHHDKPTQ